jgi:hypothetical protein
MLLTKALPLLTKPLPLGVGEEEVAEALRLLFDAVKDEYPELLDDAAKLACKFLQAVGGLLR